MAWTYSADPANNTRDAVRLLIGDTNTSDQQLQDSEVAFFISAYGDTYLAAGAAARALAAKYARLCDKEVGDLVIDYSQRRDAYFELAERLETQAVTLAGASPFLGGNSVSDKEGVYEDTGKVQPYFARDQFDNSGVLTDQPFDSDDI